jgi:hypothetical protein
MTVLDSSPGVSCKLCGAGAGYTLKEIPFAEAGQNSIFPCNNSNAHGSKPYMSAPDAKQSPVPSPSSFVVASAQSD